MPFSARYPGRLAQLKVIQELGFLNEEPINVAEAAKRGFYVNLDL